MLQCGFSHGLTGIKTELDLVLASSCLSGSSPAATIGSKCTCPRLPAAALGRGFLRMTAAGCPLCYFPTALFFVALCGSGAVPRRKDCQFPDPPDHSTYRCMSPACQLALGGGVFKAGSMVQYDCEAGYVPAGPPGVAVCKGGRWHVTKPVVCKPLAGSPPMPRSGALLAVSSIPVVAAASVTISALLLVAMVCVLVGPKPRTRVCWSRWYERMEEPEMLSSGDSCLVPLPSYEEAIYGSQGDPVLPAPPMPTPLVLSRGLVLPAEAVESHGSPEAATPPPSYQESQAAAAGGSSLARHMAPPARFLFPGARKEQGR
nr:sushi domain-containing protein 6-like isoform X1 [Pelodiscus sinensis]|eukprot:XP_014435338.1 sushi domain-containing protein 6-like isoform X1 [Pelodiscus sinensis]